MKIAITGETGFLGYHITQYFKYQLGYDMVSLTRDYQSNIRLIKDCDWLIHCAGVNRGETVYNDNISLAKELVDLLQTHNIKINIAFTSSVQEFAKTEYGLSKSISSNILNEYCINTDKKFISYKLPNLFGPFGKANYNSVVSTFCYNLVNGNTCQVNDNKVDLCYVHDAIYSMKLTDTECTYSTTNISIKELYEKLKRYHLSYSTGIIPELNSHFDIHLFNTYRSFSDCTHKFIRHTDDRGYLIELLKSEGTQSQIFFSTTKPGITRGNHFHFNKIERFCILKGTADISMRKIGSNDVISYIVTEDMNMVVDIPVMYTHNIKNIEDRELICVFWTNEIFDAENPDTFFVNV